MLIAQIELRGVSIVGFMGLEEFLMCHNVVLMCSLCFKVAVHVYTYTHAQSQLKTVVRGAV